MKQSIIIFMFSVVCTQSCQEQNGLFGEDIPESRQELELKVNVLSHNNIITQYIPTGTPNRYDAKISWPRFNGTIKLRNSDQSLINDDPISTNQYLVRNLEGGQKRIINFETYNTERTAKSQIEIILLPPKDIVFEQSFALTEDKEISAGRIFILDLVKIYTNQFCFKLKFNELIIGYGVEIYNFAPDQKAASETDGKSGGCFELEGNRAVGVMKLKINSEGGGDGKKGFPRCEGTHAAEIFYDCFGTNGASSGLRGNFQIELENSSEFQYDYEFLEVPGGARGAKDVDLTTKQRTEVCSAWLNPRKPAEVMIARHKSCDVASKDGERAIGGKICVKLSKDSNYECSQ